MLIALSRGIPGRTAERREAMQALSRRFPGALREWDTQPHVELLRRREVVKQALADAEARRPVQALSDEKEPWLRYALDLHFHLREVLRLRRWTLLHLPGRSSLAFIDDECLAACQRFHERAGEPVLAGRLTAAVLAAIVSPPGGSLQSVAYAEVAAHHGVPVDAIKRALFQPAKEVHAEET